jgi:hypothetical protein
MIFRLAIKLSIDIVRLAKWSLSHRNPMFKLLVLLVSAIPILLFLKNMFFSRSERFKKASADLKRQIDYLVWTILVLVGLGILYSLFKLIWGSH